jgi:hypothetical protein
MSLWVSFFGKTSLCCPPTSWWMSFVSFIFGELRGGNIPQIPCVSTSVGQ